MNLRKLLRSFVLPAFFVLWAQAALAQKVITGRVTDASGNGVPSVTVTVKGTNTATSTDAEGRYSLNVPATGNTLVFSSIGYQSQEATIGNRTEVNASLQTTTGNLTEVVVIGYGTQRRRDLTGSIATVTSEDFQKGNISTPEQLIAGKVAGVQITTGGGAPGAGTTIRIRGGSSLSASNDPLIVIDGVPLDNTGVSGVANPLSFINPNDIESFNILKDASATAIYGSRASNGVILITTKKGTSGRLRVNFSTNQAVSTVTKKVDVLSADEYRAVVKAHGSPDQIALLGTANTDWQDEIYQTAFSTDNNISFSGGITGLPYRASIGYMNQRGVLLEDRLRRVSGALNLSPRFIDNHLTVNLNAKGSVNTSHFSDQGAIGSAVFFDPTQPVIAEGFDEFGGYFEWLDNSGNPNTLAPRNPVSILRQRRDNGTLARLIGNAQFDYKFHFLPELRANLNLGLDVSESDGIITLPPRLASVYTVEGTRTQYVQRRNSELMEFYLNYAGDISSIRSRVDATAGYSYQDWTRSNPAFPTLRGNGSRIEAGNPFKTQVTLISFFGRLNYTLNDKYLLTATVRRDGSSRFAEENRWGTFPSVALAWRLNQENFLKNSRIFSDLKLRAGYGVTGQQDIGNDFPYFARYAPSDLASSYSLGNTFYNTLRPAAYDKSIKWEETETWNAGVDLGFLNGRISTSLDYYFRKTKDLLAYVNVPAGSNFSNRLYTNVGNIESKGVELNLNAVPVKTRNFNWDANFNLTWNQREITNLSKVLDTTSVGLEVGGISGGVGNTIQVHTVGYTPLAFYVYKQVYDQNGKPIEGAYVDLNKDGVINEDDKYRYKQADPEMLLGFSSQFGIRNWTLGFTMRGSFGSYMYNNFMANNGTFQNFRYANYLGNISSSVLETNFEGTDSRRFWSDYYLDNASFLRMDNFNVGYNFGKLKSIPATLRVNATVQNVFVITNYEGLDPEIQGGIDNNFYPRPRIYSLGLNLDF